MLVVALALALADPAPPQAAAPAAPVVDTNAISFALDVPRIVLGDTKHATLLIRAQRADGSPLDAGEPRVATSVGSFGPLARTAPGMWTAEYTPPASGPPQVAIVLAAVGTDAVSFFTIPLWGKGATVVKTKPGSEVTVKAGASMFGPVKADASGTAQVPLVLPPGVRTATTRALDEVGNAADRPIDLGVPPLARTALLALDEVAIADGGGKARLYAVTLDENGAPQKQAPLAAKASEGQVSVDGEPVPGLRALTLKVPHTQSRSVNVEVSLGAGPPQKARVALIPGPPAGALIKLSRENVGDDDADRDVLVDVRLIDGAGNPLPAQAAGIHVDVGGIEHVATDAEGWRHFTWIIPSGTGEKRATLSVRTGAGDVVATAGFDLPPPKPAVLVFDPVDFVVADGENGVDLVVRARDRHNRSVAPEGVVLTVDGGAGKLSAPAPFSDAPEPPTHDRYRHTRTAAQTGPGMKVRFVPTAVAEKGAVTVRAVLGAAHAQTTVPLAPPPPPLLLRAGLAAGSNYGKLAAAGVDLSALWRVWGPVSVGVDAGALQSLFVPGGADQRSFPLLAEGMFRPRVSPDLGILLGLAAGPVLSDLVEKPGGAHDLEVALAGQLVLGAAFELGPVPLDAFVRLGTAVYVGHGVALDAVGVPLGATAVVAWRFAP